MDRVLRDLARYRMAIEEEDLRVRGGWSATARTWYSQAADLSVNTGRIQHHVAVLARPNILQQPFLYSKALVAAIPFKNAGECIQLLFEPSVEQNTPWHSHSYHQVAQFNFISAAAVPFPKRSIIELELYRKLQSDDLEVRSGAKFKVQGPEIAGLVLGFGDRQMTLHYIENLATNAYLKQAELSPRLGLPTFRKSVNKDSDAGFMLADIQLSISCRYCNEWTEIIHRLHEASTGKYLLLAAHLETDYKNRTDSEDELPPPLQPAVPLEYTSIKDWKSYADHLAVSNNPRWHTWRSVYLTLSSKLLKLAVCLQFCHWMKISLFVAALPPRRPASAAFSVTAPINSNGTRFEASGSISSLHTTWAKLLSSWLPSTVAAAILLLIERLRKQQSSRDRWPLVDVIHLNPRDYWGRFVFFWAVIRSGIDVKGTPAVVSNFFMLSGAAALLNQYRVSTEDSVPQMFGPLMMLPIWLILQWLALQLVGDTPEDESYRVLGRWLAALATIVIVSKICDCYRSIAGRFV